MDIETSTPATPPAPAPISGRPHRLGPRQTPCDVSIIIPIHNEEDNVEPLYLELAEVMDATPWDYEIVFIDDGSKDRSLQRLREQVGDNPRVTIIELRRNFEQMAVCHKLAGRLRANVVDIGQEGAGALGGEHLAVEVGERHRIDGDCAAGLL